MRKQQLGERLTPLEIDILLCLARGMTRHDIAFEFGYSKDNKISRLTYAIRVKLGANTDPHAVVIAHKTGIIDLDEEA